VYALEAGSTRATIMAAPDGTAALRRGREWLAVLASGSTITRLPDHGDVAGGDVDEF
jgi:hypothetical protein